MADVTRHTEAWQDKPWHHFHRVVFRLQKRIYQASQRGDSRTVHKLQRLLLASSAARHLAVRRVTQDNQGKRTAGIDGRASLKPHERLQLVQALKQLEGEAMPLRRTSIPKPGTTERRPLGIPTMDNRARHALVKLALEPEGEAKFEPNSYGFRPGRSTHDAIGAIFLSIKHTPKYVLDLYSAHYRKGLCGCVRQNLPPRYANLIGSYLGPLEPESDRLRFQSRD